MSSATPVQLVQSAPIQASDARTSTRAWLVGPAFDLIFVANLLWPLAVLVSLSGTTWLLNPLTVFQLYFLSTPHRWITLVLVFGDTDRFWKEPVRFGVIGLGLLGLGLGLVWLGSIWPTATDSLVLLMMLDYAWNSWHFAAQHAGVARIYSRVGRLDFSEKEISFERMAIRLVVIWVFFRLAVHVGAMKATADFLPRSDFLPQSDLLLNLQHSLGWIDLLMVAPIALLLARELLHVSSRGVGRVVYIASVAALYSAQLAAIHMEIEPLMVALFLAGAIFHATEYLAVVNWSVRKKTTGVWRYHLTRTVAAVLVFAVVLGIANAAVDHHSAYTWALVTLLVSLLHYGYDGMIWKSPRRPKANTV